MSKIRLYIVPLVFTLAALGLWWQFREQENSVWWLAVVILIFASQLGLYLKRKNI